MNQQRSRRFRASKETSEKLSEMDRIRSELSLKGAFLPPEKPKGEHFDSNCITPVCKDFSSDSLPRLIFVLTSSYYRRGHRLWPGYQLVCIITYTSD